MRLIKILLILGSFIITPDVLFAQTNFQSKAESIYEDLTENVEKIDSVASATEARINAVFDSIRSLKKYINILDSSRIISLPVGLPNVLKSPNYDIAITQANFHTGGATFNANMMIINPFDGKRLCFEAQNVPFSYSGGMSGDARLLLVSEKSFKICNGVRMFVLPGSFVEFNCNGFKSLTLKGKVVLSGKTFVKVNTSGDSISGPIEAYFETTINDWNNLFLSLNNIDPFRLRNVPDVSFECNNLTIDYSDYRNPNNMNTCRGKIGYRPAFGKWFEAGIKLSNLRFFLNTLASMPISPFKYAYSWPLAYHPFNVFTEIILLGEKITAILLKEIHRYRECRHTRILHWD